MRRLLAPVLLVALMLAVVAAAEWGTLTAPLPQADPVMVNDLARRYESAWPTVSAVSARGAPAHTVVTGDGQVKVSVGQPITSELQGMRRGASTVTLRHRGLQVGTLYVETGAAQLMRDRQRRAAQRVIGLLGMAVAILVLYALWLYRRILLPFTRLQHLAVDVAQGRLDRPLAMDRHHLFGAFSESFDLLRTQLAQARRRHDEAQQSKRALVSDLRHDLRTPVATIAATAELLSVTESDPRRRDRLGVILAKAHQIDSLSTDLARVGSDDLQALDVQVESCSTVQLSRAIEHCGGEGLVAQADLEPAIVLADPRRLSQVFDNLLSNAAKYAGAPVVITGAVVEDLYEIRVRDHGPGLPDDELAAVLARGVRGSTAGALPGQGLGLHTAAQLAAALGGALELRNHPQGGLVAELTLPLDR